MTFQQTTSTLSQAQGTRKRPSTMSCFKGVGHIRNDCSVIFVHAFSPPLLSLPSLPSLPPHLLFSLPPLPLPLFLPPSSPSFLPPLPPSLPPFLPLLSLSSSSGLLWNQSSASFRHFTDYHNFSPLLLNALISLSICLCLCLSLF